MKYLRWLLFPFSLLYGLAVITRNWCYDAGFFKSYKFNKPIISIGNLDVGGAGKSPMTEYLVRLLKDDHKLATLSRGYGRETKGYIVAAEKNQESRAKSQEQGIESQESRAKSQEPGIESQESRAKSQEQGIESQESRAKSQEQGIESQESRAKSQEPGIESQESRAKSQEPGIESQESREKSQEQGVISYEPFTAHHSPPTTHHSPLTLQVGDEPAQFKHKFPYITVAVCEKRVEGIKKLLWDHDLILLDDAYQHRAVEPGLSILLFDYNRLDEPHLLLPAGNLREPFSGRWRAQIIVATKCPSRLTDEEKGAAAQKIEPLPYQKLFFSSIAYQPLVYLDSSAADVVIDNQTTVFLLTGIANAEPMMRYFKGFTPHIIHHNYPDHHRFTLKNIAKLAAGFSACETQKKLIVTTEKDAQRLEESWFRSLPQAAGRPPVFVIPIKVEFLNGSGQAFNQQIIEYVRAH